MNVLIFVRSWIRSKYDHSVFTRSQFTIIFVVREKGMGLSGSSGKQTTIPALPSKAAAASSRKASLQEIVDSREDIKFEGELMWRKNVALKKTTKKGESKESFQARHVQLVFRHSDKVSPNCFTKIALI